MIFLDFKVYLAPKIRFLYHAKLSIIGTLNLRFYVEGHEVDVQDPKFFMDEAEYAELEETLDEMLNDYI